MNVAIRPLGDRNEWRSTDGIIAEQGGATSYLVWHQQDGVAVRFLVRSVATCLTYSGIGQPRGHR